ncbi:FAD-dependent oxidoreductase [Streptomyces sp. WI04-05B]|uniref:FAD-dependent oxidoreductase n=1 Tax=Streptomyces TaxID=1883 RepID=UPI0029B54AD2|nr:MULTISPECIES: FAD-dependent oxidoreductase [unclassified Streptomyces]MDX2548900.1 FAD-dependent oxidoreductase [Streptomyces sp. WI04-05B]MDX2590517.1 FAD-dependent oxidoreductase [Streptomyces sp. WI04-05A]MDX3745697.1 FAD-dependent oxidoreductase [Streptomyces sp. AK08-02]
MESKRAKKVLVIGGGMSGNVLTVLLRRAGIDVDLVEIKPDWNVRGSGITLQGNALRVLRETGVWDEVREHGFGFDTLGMAAPDGTVFHVGEVVRTGGDELPATLGMQRPVLQRILIEAVRASGANVRLGTGTEIVDQDDASVTVRFSDGTEGRYDLVVAADGLNSTTRAAIGIDDKPEPTGMAIWRTPAPRPAGVRRSDLTFGGPCFIAGYTPTSENTIYAILVERSRDRATIPPETYAREMRRLAEGYGGVWEEIRESITDPAQVNYTWFDQLLVKGSWHRGRVILIGDAAHCCPPTMALGAAMALEDAWVLAQILTEGPPWDTETLTRYYERRIDRVRMVVDASVRIGQWQLDGVRGDLPGLIDPIMATLRELP